MARHRTRAAVGVEGHGVALTITDGVGGKPAGIDRDEAVADKELTVLKAVCGAGGKGRERCRRIAVIAENLEYAVRRRVGQQDLQHVVEVVNIFPLLGLARFLRRLDNGHINEVEIFGGVRAGVLLFDCLLLGLFLFFLGGEQIV